MLLLNVMKNIKGLSSEEALKLQKQFGPNEFVKREKPSPLKKFIGVFKEPMFLLLLGTSILYFILGEPKEACIMLFFVVFVATITFVQEWKTEKTINSLKDLTSPKITVLRDGKKQIISSSCLVPGDIIFVKEGERIPADCEVLKVSNFSVDESILTGEAETVFKVPTYDLEDDPSNDHWKKNIIYAGTLSIFGTCTGKVLSIGFNTEYGKISKSISEAKEEPTPLQKKTGNLIKNLAITGFILCILVIGISYFHNKNLLQSILSGLTLAMAIIPEEFPVVLTVYLSLGAFRLAKKNTLMRKISAVETLGSTTVLAVDKTGTITKNQMEVKKLFLNNKFYTNKEKIEESFGKLMILSCEDNPYDPMEKALVNHGKNNCANTELNNNFIPQRKFSFNNKTKRMANVFKTSSNYYIACKGSPETVLELCNLSNNEKNKILNSVDNLASEGLRVLAFAEQTNDVLYENLEDYTLEFVGLVALQDPPREGVKESIKLCNEAGIRVVMITGDYSKTAISIGSEVGLKYSDNVLTGDEISNLNDEELKLKVAHCNIFSRVMPEHKMRIVKALKANGEIVAMTGDGVNDAPALKHADIGIAMGKRGTEVAKEAAHMILMDDNFSTIVNSVKDGRRIFDNIRKAIIYIMVIHIPIIALALFSPIFNLPQILLPAHIMLLELIIDPTCSIIFELEEAEPYIMSEPPRSPDEPLLPKQYVLKVLLQGASMFLAAFIPFHYLVDNNFSIEVARSFSLITLIFSNIILVLVNRSNTNYIISSFKEDHNKTRLLINGVAFILVLAITYIPLFNNLFNTKPLTFPMLILAILLGFLSSIWFEAVKLYNNSKKINLNHSKSI